MVAKNKDPDGVRFWTNKAENLDNWQLDIKLFDKAVRAEVNAVVKHCRENISVFVWEASPDTVKAHKAKHYEECLCVSIGDDGDEYNPLFFVNIPISEILKVQADYKIRMEKERAACARLNSTPEQEVMQVTKLARIKGESKKSFRRRLALQIQKLDEEEWDDLKPETQKWVNLQAKKLNDRSDKKKVAEEVAVKKKAKAKGSK